MIIRDYVDGGKRFVSELYYELHPIEEKEKRDKGLLVPVERSGLRSVVLVAEVDNRVVGFVWGNLIFYGFFRYAMIEELFVRKEFRGRGLGSLW